MRKSPRAIALASQSRIVLFAAIWLSLFAYAGRPVLAGAAAMGVAPAGAWTILLVLALLPLLPFLARRAYTTGYTILALFSSLLVLVLLSDVARGVYLFARAMAGQSWPLLDTRILMLAILGTAGVLSVIGLAQARCPRIRRVSVAIDELPEELEGYRIVQWSDVHVGPTIRKRFVQSLVDRTNALEADGSRSRATSSTDRSRSCARKSNRCASCARATARSMSPAITSTTGAPASGAPRCNPSDSTS